MNLNKTFLVLALFLMQKTMSFCQDTGSLTPMPSTKEEFIKSEPAIISVADWLENTPLNLETDKRKYLNTLLLTWLTNSPTITIEIDSKITPLSKKNPDLLPVFMAGWTKYSLQNAYSKDPVKCNLAGIKSVLRVYKMGEGVKKDKDIDKLAELDAKNELESWIAAKLEKK